MYRYSRKETAVSKKTRDILIIVIGVLILINAIQFFAYRSSGSREDVIRGTLVGQMQENIDAALAVVPQLGRTGGSSTMKWLALTRQHLYAMTQINDLAAVLLGQTGDLVPSDAINTATLAIDECERQLSAGLSMDTQLNILWGQLTILSEAAIGLSLR